jgi:serine/threonine protein kinase
VRQLGKYLLIEPIASGGMAEVWRAEVAGPAGFVKQVAVKLVRADRGDDDEMIRMFIQEAKLASSLHHANIVQVHGLDLIEGRYVIAMELVHGRSLRAVLDRCRETNVRFGLPRAVHLAEQVSRALAYAHRPVSEGGAAGLVHRDVSPHNVLVSFEGEVKLTDFGIARVQGAGGLTGPGTLKGKIGYMAPEHAMAAPVDARADIFALGVVLWEMCTGQRLFARDTEAATLRVLIGDDRISPPSFWNELVPPELDAIVLGALERDPARRTSSADEVARRLAEVELALSRTPEDRDLRPLMRRLWPGEIPSRPTPTPSPLPGEASSGPVTPAPQEAPTATWPPRRHWGLAASVAGLAVVTGAVGVVFWVGVRGTSPDPGRQPVPVAAARAAPAPVGGEPLPAADAPKGPATTPSPAASLAQPAVAPVAANARPAAPPAGEGSRGAPVARAARPAGPAPTVSAAPARTTGERRPVVLASADALEGLEVPPASSGQGILFVNATPWAEVHVDGFLAGYTPREMRLAAGAHRLKLVHPTRGTVVKDTEVRAGERVRVETDLGP